MSTAVSRGSRAARCCERDGAAMEDKQASADPSWMAAYRADATSTATGRDALGSVARLVVEKDGVYTEFGADAWDVGL